MKPNLYCLVTAAVFTVVALLHLLRIIFGWSVLIAGWHVPFWLSWLAIVVLAVLVFYGIKLARDLR